MCQKVPVIANSAVSDENIHNEQSDQGQHCLPSNTGNFNSVQMKPYCYCCFGFNGPYKDISVGMELLEREKGRQ